MACLNNIAAFRCNACGHLEDCGHAGECKVPLACSACGAGVIHSPTAKKLAVELADPNCTVDRRVAIAQELARGATKSEGRVLDPNNWEVLADATPERLAELGLDAAHVERHRWTVTVPPDGTHVVVSATDVPGSANQPG